MFAASHGTSMVVFAAQGVTAMNHRKTIGAGNIPRMIFIGGSGMLNYRNLSEDDNIAGINVT